MKRQALFIIVLASVSSAFGLTACKSQHKGFTYMPDMSYSPAIKAQKEGPGSMLTPPKGTIARGFKTYEYKDQPELAGKMLHNPLPRTKDVLLKGQNLFNTYCIVMAKRVRVMVTWFRFFHVHRHFNQKKLEIIQTVEFFTLLRTVRI